ncbi:MAG: carbon storage regulator [Pirellulales bacterium]
MLVLSRKIGEKITVDGGITVVVVAVKGNTVRIGIDAPAETQIMRNELMVRSPDDEGEAA